MSSWTAKALAVMSFTPYAVHWLTDVVSAPPFPNDPVLLCGPSCQTEGVHTEELDNDLGMIFFSVLLKPSSWFCMYLINSCSWIKHFLSLAK